jgi:hypothetical protein
MSGPQSLMQVLAKAFRHSDEDSSGDRWSSLSSNSLRFMCAPTYEPLKPQVEGQAWSKELQAAWNSFSSAGVLGSGNGS